MKRKLMALAIAALTFLGGSFQSEAAKVKATSNPETSVVDFLESKGQDSSWKNRTELAKNAGIKGYTGKPARQNVALLRWLKAHQNDAVAAVQQEPLKEKSIVDYLKKKGQDSTLAARSVLAKTASIDGYTGKPAHNVALLRWLIKGDGVSISPVVAPAPAPSAETENKDVLILATKERSAKDVKMLIEETYLAWKSARSATLESILSGNDGKAYEEATSPENRLRVTAFVEGHSEEIGIETIRLLSDMVDKTKTWQQVEDAKHATQKEGKEPAPTPPPAPKAPTAEASPAPPVDKLDLSTQLAEEAAAAKIAEEQRLAKEQARAEAEKAAKEKAAKEAFIAKQKADAAKEIARKEVARKAKEAADAAEAKRLADEKLFRTRIRYALMVSVGTFVLVLIFLLVRSGKKPVRTVTDPEFVQAYLDKFINDGDEQWLEGIEPLTTEELSYISEGIRGRAHEAKSRKRLKLA